MNEKVLLLTVLFLNNYLYYRNVAHHLARVNLIQVSGLSQWYITFIFLIERMVL